MTPTNGPRDSFVALFARSASLASTHVMYPILWSSPALVGLIGLDLRLFLEAAYEKTKKDMTPDYLIKKPCGRNKEHAKYKTYHKHANNQLTHEINNAGG